MVISMDAIYICLDAWMLYIFALRHTSGVLNLMKKMRVNFIDIKMRVNFIDEC